MKLSRNSNLIIGIIAIAVGIIGLIIIFSLLGSRDGAGFRGFCPLCGGGTPGFRGPGRRGPGGFGKQPGAGTINLKSATDIAKTYISGTRGLKLDEIVEFDDSFEAEFKESKTGVGAFEILIDRTNGSVFSEMGPNMMWNTKYGMMGGRRFSISGKANNKMNYSANQAKTAAKNYLKQNGIEMTVGGPEIYYGFYEFHLLNKGKPGAQIDVNGFTGDVWYEDWHGPILSIKEF